MHSHLRDIGLVQYMQTIQDHGFETWQDLASITESDLEQIGMLRGHRRRLQRALHLSSSKEYRTCSSLTSIPTQSHQKRRYRRRPKHDPSAPARPKTAYQSFADNTRQQMLDQSVSFVELSRLVGSRWAMQSVVERNTWTSPASKAKLRFQDQLRLYEKTPEYLEYQEYLQNFKNQHNPSRQVQQGSEAGSEEIHADKPLESTRGVAFPGSQAMSLPGQHGQITSCDTGDHTQVGSGEKPLPEIERCEEVKHALPATLPQADDMDRNRATSIRGYEENPVQDSTRSFPCTPTRRLEESQYFRTVLQT